MATPKALGMDDFKMFGQHPTLAEAIQVISDAKSFKPLDIERVSMLSKRLSKVPNYTETIKAARERSGNFESVTIGTCNVGGYQMVMIVSNFNFLAGTMGVIAGEVIVEAFEHAEAMHLPVVGVTSSGGARMQEGPIAVAQMLKVGSTIDRFKRTGGLYVVYNDNPTAGGVYSSWGSMGHLCFGRPNSFVGLTGARIVAGLKRESPIPVQDTEYQFQHGFLDGLCDLREFREILIRLFSAFGSTPEVVDDAGASDLESDCGQLGLIDSSSVIDAWESVKRSRFCNRLSAGKFIRESFGSVTYLNGNRISGRADPLCLSGIASVGSRPVVFYAQDRDVGGKALQPGPESFHQAIRAISIADDLGIPFVSIIDSPGASTTLSAEGNGVAQSIGGTIAAANSLKSPSVSILLGEGGGGGVIPLLLSDYVISTENSWLAPISPEAASLILYKTQDRAAEVARFQSISSVDLLQNGIVDVVIAECDSGDNDKDCRYLASGIKSSLEDAIRKLCAIDVSDRLELRRARFRNYGLSLLVTGTSEQE